MIWVLPIVFQSCFANGPTASGFIEVEPCHNVSDSLSMSSASKLFWPQSRDNKVKLDVTEILGLYRAFKKKIAAVESELRKMGVN